MVFLAFFFYLFSSNCASKEICFTTDSYLYSCSGVSITSVDETTNIEEKLRENIDDTITDISVSLSGNFEYNFPFILFNNKKVSIKLGSGSSGNFDVSDIQNINIEITAVSYSSMSQVTFQGSTLSDDQSSLSLEGIKLTFDVEEIRLKSFSYERSEFSFTKISVNSFTYQIKENYELTFDDNDLIFDGITVIFTGTDQSLTLESTSSSNELVINNQIPTGLSITNFYFKLLNSITFNGNEFSETTTLSFSDCLNIISNVGFLPISSFSSGSYSKHSIIASKSLVIKGSIPISSSSTLIFGTADDCCSSRITIEIDSIVFLNYNAAIQFSSSWIDLTANSFTLPSNTYKTIPIYPCIGSGGSSTVTFNTIDYNGQSTLSFSSLKIFLDVTGEQTDESLALLMSKEWNVITFKSFTLANKIDKFTSITYSPTDINGFQSSSSILTAKSTVSEDYVVTFIASSYKSLPLLLCYTTSSTCSYGTVISDMTTLPDIVPDYTKQINLTLTTSLDELDLSSLSTTGATFTLTASSSYNGIDSIKTSDFSEDANIKHLIIKSISLKTGNFQLNLACQNGRNEIIQFLVNQPKFERMQKVDSNHNSIKNHKNQ